MDSFEYNKIIGALLGTIFVIFSISLVSEAVFSSPHPETAGFAIEVAEAAAPAGGEAAATEQPIGPMLASADIAKGEAIFKKCHACHDATKRGPNKVGPNLYEVVGRPVGTHEGYSYSAGMKTFSEGGAKHWDYDLLAKFLLSPKAEVPGTSMGFAGLKKENERADVIAYLRSLADSPQPLPAADAAPAGGDAAAPAEEAKPAQ